MKNINIYALVIGIFVVAGFLGFMGGMMFEKGRQPSFVRMGNARFGQVAGQMTQNRNGGFRPVMGEIISSDDKSISVKMSDGSSKVVLFGANLAINKAAEGSKDDLKIGTRVSVFGTTNTDGSVSATNIQIMPAQPKNN